MKRPLYLALLVLAACAGESQAEKDARAVCDCLQKNADGTTAQKIKCVELQRTAGEKYLDDPEALQKYNELVTPCVMDMTKKTQDETR